MLNLVVVLVAKALVVMDLVMVILVMVLVALVIVITVMVLVVLFILLSVLDGFFLSLIICFLRHQIMYNHTHSIRIHRNGIVGKYGKKIQGTIDIGGRIHIQDRSIEYLDDGVLRLNVIKHMDEFLGESGIEMSEKLGSDLKILLIFKNLVRSSLIT